MGPRGGCLRGPIQLRPSRAIEFSFRTQWPGFTSTFAATPEGAKGDAVLPNGSHSAWQLKMQPRPKLINEKGFVLELTPGVPVYFVTGMGEPPGFKGIDQLENVPCAGKLHKITVAAGHTDISAK
jgi:hypothetical protein